MNLGMVFRIALRALARHKLRSALTMLGIIIGVGAVITMVGVGQGANKQVQSQIATLGSNTLFVSAGSGRSGHFHGGLGSIRTLVYDDMLAILHECSAVKRASPGVGGGVQVIYGNQNWQTRLSGVGVNYFSIKDWDMAQGTTFTAEDVDLNNNVVVLGNEVKKQLFSGENPIGKTVRIKNLPFRVVGIATEKGQSGMGFSQDDQIFTPYTTAQKKVLGTTWLNYIIVQAVSREATGLAQKQMEDLLRERHRIRPPDQEDDFAVRNLADVAQLADQASQVMTLLLGAVASVSLLVGGIGIMNIMLVSVTERTREIGVRMAIGATEADVQAQFLTEAMVLSVMGGVMGIIFGLVASRIVSTVLEWPSAISPLAIIVAVLFSAAMGMFFGLYPARKASRLDPIEALRYE
ncbi:MAG TPA: ABC transporter permease [Bryobacterales bacterium]|nr:ABC transporter permease [Bryobacterales bacterium]